MTNTPVVAVITAFEPDGGLLTTLDSVIGQVHQVIIVDDGSPSLLADPTGTVGTILDDCAAAGAHVIRTGANNGIAAALNRGVEHALATGAGAVLTLDQDTQIGADYLARALDHLNLAASVGLELVMAAPSMINNDVAPFWFAAQGLTLAFEPLQSGLLIPRTVFEAIGLFEEGLFIDCVETEFYLRARARGGHAVIVPGTTIVHSLGRQTRWSPPTPLRWILRGRAGGAAIEFSEDAPFRHYYIARNRLELYRRYARSEPLWAAVSVAKDTISRGRAMLIGSDRLSRIYLTTAGANAALHHRSGRIPTRVLRRARRLRRTTGGESPAPALPALDVPIRGVPQLVSVIIPVHDGVDVIDEQLTALAAQTYGGEFEVIVADNGSTDGLREHLDGHRLGSELQLRWIDAAQRPGSAYARNAGAAAARGDFLAFCDDDDRVSPGWLSELTAAATNCAAVGGALETHTLNSPRAQSWRQMLPADTPYEMPGFLRSAPTCNLGVWREVFEAVGGFDTTYDRGSEDADFTFRIQLAGGEIGHAPKALVAYRLRDTLTGIWEQSVMCGEGHARLYADYRRHGMPTRPWWATLDVIAYLLLRNPALPSTLTRVPTGRWLFQAGNLVGRVKGSMRHRCWYI